MQNIFDLRNSIISDYCSYVKGFIKVKDPAIRQRIEEEIQEGLLWPDPIVQLNPSFKPGKNIDALVQDGTLHPKCKEIFRTGKSAGVFGSPLSLYQHQVEAIEKAKAQRNYILTTGTGSGKSLSYIIPIVNYVLENRQIDGVKALVVYPMNALANSQEKELEKFLGSMSPEHGAPLPPVTFRRFTGQEREEEKNHIRQNPPDILLTNYVMLEYLLTRSEDAKLLEKFQSLHFLVLDELHTYRGRQGADVAMLIRRTREASRSEKILTVGTSATLASQGTLAEQAKEVAEMGTLLFGQPVEPDDIIGETLIRETREYSPDDPSDLRKEVEQFATQPDFHPTYDELKQSRFASWIESTFGVRCEEESGVLRRQQPRAIRGENGAAAELAKVTGLSSEICEKGIQQIFLAGNEVRHSGNPRPFFAFRLHQFISRGDTLYATLEKERRFFNEKQAYAPGGREKRLYPLLFCRNCGQEYYSVLRLERADRIVYEPLDIDSYSRDEINDGETGYLVLPPEGWSVDPAENLDRYPDDWKESTGELKRERRKAIPQYRYLNPLGEETSADDPSALPVLFVPSPFRFCPECQVSYSTGTTRHNEFSRLGSLATEGRSSATTMIALSVINHLRQSENLPPEAQKLLSFTDNRQDASLQSGHFNDFVNVSFIRGALYRALEAAGDQKIVGKALPQRVYEAMELTVEEISADKDAVKGNAATKRILAFQDYLGYHLFSDLRRGWRLLIPNLEQTGLLKIDYEGLSEVARDENWSNAPLPLRNASAETRERLMRVLLNEIRKNLAIKADCLEYKNQKKILESSNNLLDPQWGFDPEEEVGNLRQSVVVYPCAKADASPTDNKSLFISPRSAYGRYLFKNGNLSEADCQNGRKDDAQVKEIIESIFKTLNSYGILVKSSEETEGIGYQLDSESLYWMKGDGVTSEEDPLRLTKGKDEENINPFFKDFYRLVAATLKNYSAREHTAQITYEEREKREEDFRSARLPLLFCSPTMELGIDISQLNVVHLRNVPPTPANYAQRSGRAGRSGQPALIFTYCTYRNQHDHYFFNRPELMVSGAVQTPQIDLANEELLKAHVHAVWLSEAALTSHFGLGKSLETILDVPKTGDTDLSMELTSYVTQVLENTNLYQTALSRVMKIFQSIHPLIQSENWYKNDWVSNILKEIQKDFNKACDRWRDLYKAAFRQQEIQNKKTNDGTNRNDQETAKRLRAEAEQEMRLLKGGDEKTDFYSYRYFASEGFLPGYNFPRLPVFAYIPGEGNPAFSKKKGESEYLTRSRFLAISEFGPRALIYHNGSRYVINKVSLPMQEEGSEVTLKSGKVCPRCGYIHLPDQENLYNNCESCHTLLSSSYENLLPLTKVSTKRRLKISCDEEERMRFGYDIKNYIQFSSSRGELNRTQMEILLPTGDGGEGERFGTLTYAGQASIYRINHGYRRQQANERNGFPLDMQRGFWKNLDDLTDPSVDTNDPLSKEIRQVRPFVTDTRNALLFCPEKDQDFSVEEMATLQAAIQRAIQRQFGVEENELAAYPLPDEENRAQILFYESSEGGAGVLKNLLNEEKFRKVILCALDLCHYDPATGADKKKADFAKEECGCACYHCLLSYSNQREHSLLDRSKVLPILLRLKEASLKPLVEGKKRDEQFQILFDACETDLEKKWLTIIHENNLRLPNYAQYKISDLNITPDFIYRSDDNYTAVFIDGPAHDPRSQQEKDHRQEEDLSDSGWEILRFHHSDQAQWLAQIKERKDFFGE